LEQVTPALLEHTNNQFTTLVFEDQQYAHETIE
jgi:hypothetical protein